MTTSEANSRSMPYLTSREVTAGRPRTDARPQREGPGPAAVGRACRGRWRGPGTSSPVVARARRVRDQLAGVEPHDVPHAGRVGALRVEAVDAPATSLSVPPGGVWTARGRRSTAGVGRDRGGVGTAGRRRRPPPPQPGQPEATSRDHADDRPGPPPPASALSPGRPPCRPRGCHRGAAARSVAGGGSGRAAGGGTADLANSSASRLAPPTRAPSTSGWAMIAGDVGRLDRAAVEDPHRVGRSPAVAARPAAPRIAPHTSWASSGVADLAGADRPDRLVRDHDLGDLLGGEPVERAVELGAAVRARARRPRGPPGPRRRTGSASRPLRAAPPSPWR